jgi:hypothetical protein
MLRRVDTDPPRWLLRVNGQDVPLTTEQLMKYQFLELKVLEHCSIVLRPMKPDEWRLMLADRMRNLAVIAVPEDASTPGQILGRLLEYLQKTIDGRDMSPQERSRSIDLGRPIRVAKEDGEWSIFKGTEFIKHLKRTKGEDMRGPDLWLALRNLGVEHTVMKIGDKAHRVWMMPWTEIDELTASEPKVEI